MPLKMKILEILKKLSLILFGIFLGLVSIEIIGLIFNDLLPYPIQYSMQMGSLAQSDPDFGITIIPGQIEVKNSEFEHMVHTKDVGCQNRAFRDDGVDNKTYHILSLGDSFTWGAGVTNEETWPEMLEGLLQIDVINAGYPGIGTQQQLLLLKECGGIFKPDIIIVGFFVNDFIDNLTWRHKLGVNNFWYTNFGRPIRVWLAANSYSYQFFKYFFLGRIGIGDFENIYWSQEERNERFVIVNQDNLKLHLSRDYALYLNPEFDIYNDAIIVLDQTLSEMLLEAGKLDSQLLVVFLPSKEQVYWRYLSPELSSDLQYQVEFPNEVLADLALKNRIVFLDLFPVFEANNHQQLYWDVDSHMNAAGYKLVADSIAKFLLEQEDIIGTRSIGK